jgi:hypothetical protein
LRASISAPFAQQPGTPQPPGTLRGHHPTRRHRRPTRTRHNRSRYPGQISRRMRSTTHRRAATLRNLRAPLSPAHHPHRAALRSEADQALAHARKVVGRRTPSESWDDHPLSRLTISSDFGIWIWQHAWHLTGLAICRPRLISKLRQRKLGISTEPGPAPARVTTLIRRRESAEQEGPDQRRYGPHQDADYWR